MEQNKQKTYNLLPKQIEFVSATEKEVLFSGAWGCSKSYALCLAILKEATIPNSEILLCRKTYTSLRRSTLQTLLFGDNPVIPQGSYKYNRVDQTIKLNGLNSTIYLMGLDVIEKIRSMNLSFIAVDEASELELNEWVELLGRLRCPHGSRRIIGATNPSGPGHWLYHRFFLNTTENRKVIRATTLENPYLPEDYVKSLTELPKNLYDRFVMGNWLEVEKAIYSGFKRDIHLKSRGYGEFSKYYLGVDFGFTNPTALALCGIDGDNNLHLIEEQKHSKKLIGEIVNIAQKYYKLEPIVVVDPSAPALIAQFEKEGFRVKKADNSVDSGIARMQDYLHNAKFSAEPDCHEFIKEVESYVYDKNGKPCKVNDHLCFIADTQVLSDNGYKKIQDVNLNDKVFDGKLYNKVSNSIKTENKDVVMYRLNNRFLVCTEDHPIFVNDIKIPIGELCKLFRDKDKKELLKRLNLKEGSIEDIYITVVKNTLPVDQIGLTDYQDAYTEIYGLKKMVKYLMKKIYTIRISTIRTMILITWKLLTLRNIGRFIVKNIIKNTPILLPNKSIKTNISVEGGINQNEADSNIVNKQKSLEIEAKLLSPALTAENNQNTIILVQSQKETNSAPITVSPICVGSLAKIILRLYAKYAELLSKKINILGNQPVLESVQENLEVVNCTGVIGNLPVFNLTVDNSHRYTANDILVSNCDAVRYCLNDLVEEDVTHKAPFLLGAGDEDDDMESLNQTF